MIACGKCAFRNQDGTEFCANCGAYLGYVGQKVAPPAGDVLVTLSPPLINVQPGGEASGEVRVRNRTGVVDQFEIQVVGASAAWAVAEPTTLSLFPDTDAVAALRFRPVRSPQVPAGRQAFTVRVQSRATPTLTNVQEGLLEVAPFQEVGLDVTPHTSHGSASAGHRVVVENRGNAPLRVSLGARDPDETLGFLFDSETLLVPAGETRTAQLTAQPWKTFVEGPPLPHPFTVQVRVDGAAPVQKDAVMVQEAMSRPAPRPKFPLIPVLLALLALALIAGLVLERDAVAQVVGGLVNGKANASPAASLQPTLTPSSSSPSTSPTTQSSPSAPPVANVSVPNLTCLSPAAAQQRVEAAGLRYTSATSPSTNIPSGTVIGSSPAAGTSVPEGSEVTALISSGPPAGGVLRIPTCLIIRLPRATP